MSNSESKTEADPKYECMECGEQFVIQQQYASHARVTGHDVAGNREKPMSPGMVRRAFSKLRFGRDTDGDGKLDIHRRQLYQQIAILAVGTVVGHTLAHDPDTAYQVITAAAAIVFGGRAAASVKMLPLRPEWFDSKAFTNLGVGMIFGAALVILPWHNLLDVVSHWMGEGHAPGAH